MAFISEDVVDIMQKNEEVPKMVSSVVDTEHIAF